MPITYAVDACDAVATIDGEERLHVKSLADLIKGMGEPYNISEVIDGKVVQIRVYPIYLEDETSEVAEAVSESRAVKVPHFAANR